MTNEDKFAPQVSVIIPVRNEVHFIERCLLSILNQENVAGGFEIVVADGISEDGTRELLNSLSQADSRIILVDNPDRTTPHGMNAGIKQARGEYIAIMGAHNHYAPDYLRSSVEVLKETAADNVGGSMNCLGDSWLQQAIALAHHSPFCVGGARWHDVAYEGPADTVFGGVYRRDVFERIGLFDETLVRNQDDEFNLRLIRAGGKIWHSPRIKSWYRPRASLSALFRQYMQYGYWKVRVIQKHRIPASLRHLVPGSFVFCLVVLPVIGLLYPVLLWIWLGLIGLYLCCNLAVSLVTAAQRGWRFLPILPVVFGCYHFGYGIGFCKGTIDFLILRRSGSTSFSKLTRSSARPLRRI